MPKHRRETWWRWYFKRERLDLIPWEFILLLLGFGFLGFLTRHGFTLWH